MKQRSTKRERPVKPIYIPPVNIQLTEEEIAEEKAQAEASVVSPTRSPLALRLVARAWKRTSWQTYRTWTRRLPRTTRSSAGAPPDWAARRVAQARRGVPEEG